MMGGLNSWHERASWQGEHGHSIITSRYRGGESINEYKGVKTESQEKAEDQWT
jgi:hypothetical protein